MAGLLVDVECTNSLGPNHGLHCNHMSYIARGDASGLSAHDRSWRQLALHGNTSADGKADPKAELEAFTPAFQFSAFRFVQVTYEWPASAAPVPAPSAQSLACYRIGAGFDWTGDVVVAADDEAQSDSTEGVTTPAERFNTVVVATRSTAISNYLMDVPTDCPHRKSSAQLVVIAIDSVFNRVLFVSKGADLHGRLHVQVKSAAGRGIRWLPTAQLHHSLTCGRHGLNGWTICSTRRACSSRKERCRR